MTAVAVLLLTRPPTEDAPDAIEVIADTDQLTVKCSCAASDSQPY